MSWNVVIKSHTERGEPKWLTCCRYSSLIFLELNGRKFAFNLFDFHMKVNSHRYFLIIFHHGVSRKFVWNMKLLMKTWSVDLVYKFTWIFEWNFKRPFFSCTCHLSCEKTKNMRSKNTIHRKREVCNFR